MSSYITSLVDHLSRGFFATRAPVAAAASKTSSASSSKVAVHTGEKLFKVVCHSLIDDKRISECFSVGGHDWAVCYHPPNGDDRSFASVFLQLMSDCKSKVKTSFTFSLQDHPAATPAAAARADKNKIHITYNFLSKGAICGRSRFVRKDDLTAFRYLKDDCLVIKCSLQVTGDHHRDNNKDNNDIDSIVVPPSNLNTDLRNLFERRHKADLTIKVGGGNFTAFKVHGCMLAARSPVFRAQLCGSMMESKQSSLSIDDMDANVFEVLLYYIYNDRLPEFMDDETAKQAATNMAQHLLVAADRYGMERLKLICESKLSKALDVHTVGYILDLAEQYSCFQLKARALKYIEMNCMTLVGAIENTQGFEQLKFNHPLLARDILAKTRRCRKNEQQRTKNKSKLSEEINLIYLISAMKLPIKS